MTERTLEKANEIKKELDKAREAYEALRELQKMCWGNTGEVAARKFYIEVREGCLPVQKEAITPEVAKEALGKVMENISNEIEVLKSRLEELH